MINVAMKRVAAFTFASLAALGCASEAEGEIGADAQEASAPPSTSPADTTNAFFQPIPSGNGRACATCHAPGAGFAMSPKEAEARFQADPTDPLFRSIDADDFANDFTTVRTKALFRVTIPLPANISLVGSSEREVQLFRAVPSIQNVKLTAPYTHDGRALVLAEQAKGAALEHSRPTTLPPDSFFDAIATFQSKQFSSKAVQNISDLIDAGQAPPPVGSDYDKPLNGVEQEGFGLFQDSCALCHGGSARNAVNPAIVPNPFTSVAISEFNRAGLQVREYDVANDDGTVTRVRSADPGRMLISGRASDANRFDATQLRGVGKTAPYFHDNSSPDLVDVVKHYNRILPGAGLAVIPDDKIPAIVAYMQRL